MRLEPADIQSIVEATVLATMERIQADRAKVNGRLGYTEPEAAGLAGIAPHALRDARLRGELVASRIGKRMIYDPNELTAFRDRQRED